MGLPHIRGMSNIISRRITRLTFFFPSIPPSLFLQRFPLRRHYNLASPNSVSPNLASSPAPTDEGLTPRDSPTENPIDANSSVDAHSSDPPSPPMQHPFDRAFIHSLSDSMHYSPSDNSLFNPNSILRDPSKALAYELPHSFHTSTSFNRGPRSNSLFDDLSHDHYSISHPPKPPISQHTLDNRPPFEVDINAPAKQSHLLSQIRSNSISVGPYGTGSSLPESQQVAVKGLPLAFFGCSRARSSDKSLFLLVALQIQAQQVAAANAHAQAQALLNNLPPNLSSRDYMIALQQVQQAQNLASQVGSPLPNLLQSTPPVVSTIPGGLGNLAGTTTAPLAQEEISTIFVVGFPDDMQVRLRN